MEKRQSVGYILIVRRQHYVPTYFTQCDTRLSAQDNEDFKYTLASEVGGCEEDSVESSWQKSQFSTFKRSDSVSSEPAIRLTPIDTRKVYTTLTLSSAQAKRFSCNINKMSFGIQRNCVCDGFYGCPEEETTEKKKTVSIKKGKPVCRVPWKRRSNNLPSKPSKKRTAQAQIKPAISNDYYIKKVDMTVSRTEQADHAISLGSPLAKTASCASRNARGLKSHPGMFYSYGVVSGLHYRTACLPKRRSCDGYFGCCDEHKCSNTSMSLGKTRQGGKEKGTSRASTRTLKKK